MTNNMIQKQQLNADQMAILQSEMNKKQKSKGIAFALWFFLGILGGHRFYSGNIGYAICMILFGWVTCFIWNLIDAFFIGRSIERANDRIENKLINQIKSFYITEGI